MFDPSSDETLIESLRRAEERLRAIFTQSPIPKAVVGLDGRYVEVNDAFINLFGYRREQLAGRPMSDFTHPADRKRVQAAFEQLRSANGSRIVHEKRYIASGGRSVAVRVHAGVLLDAEGRPAAVVHQLIDLHETRVARAATRRADRAEARALHEHEIAATLQQVIRPERLPAVDGLRVSARFSAGADGVEVGGDWYDVFVLPDGEIGAVVGDVAGRGVEAAAMMTQLRHALRAYALEGHGPAATLERLNDYVRRIAEETMATITFLAIAPQGRVRAASAGHPPPMILLDGEVLRVDGAGGIPVAGVGSASYGEAIHDLPTGATLLLYTDGLVERRGESLDDGLARLERALLSAPGDIEGLLDHVFTQLIHGENARDDVALLAVRRV